MAFSLINFSAKPSWHNDDVTPFEGDILFEIFTLNHAVVLEVKNVGLIPLLTENLDLVPFRERIETARD